jgi:hypothetical protein
MSAWSAEVVSAEMARLLVEERDGRFARLFGDDAECWGLLCDLIGYSFDTDDEDEDPHPVTLAYMGLGQLYYVAIADMLVRAGYLERSGGGYEPTARALIWHAGELDDLVARVDREPRA